MLPISKNERTFQMKKLKALILSLIICASFIASFPQAACHAEAPETDAIITIEPEEPVEPEDPSDPTDPDDPAKPDDPKDPKNPIQTMEDVPEGGVDIF
jgi:hypothetical protein